MLLNEQGEKAPEVVEIDRNNSGSSVETSGNVHTEISMPSPPARFKVINADR
jgi:hypothetical protein